MMYYRFYYHIIHNTSSTPCMFIITIHINCTPNNNTTHYFNNLFLLSILPTTTPFLMLVLFVLMFPPRLSTSLLELRMS